MSAPPLPTLNDRIGVQAENWGDPLSSRIEDVGDGWLAIAPPSDGLAVHAIPPGREVVVQWMTPRGLGLVHGTVRSIVEIPIKAILIDIHGEPELVQRRRHVRAEAVIQIVVEPLGADDADEDVLPVLGSSLDIGGGGLLARVPARLKAGDAVKLRLRISDEESIEATAHVVRRIDDEVLALEFDEISVHDRERLVRQVFRLLRQALAVRDQK
jgi:hypothetical protein